jgi:WD40 repeat protein
MLAPDRRHFLRTAGHLAGGIAAADVGSALGQALPPPMDPEPALKPCNGNGQMPMPAGAIRRLGTSNMRIQGHVNAIQFSPKGNTLVSATSGELRGWDPRTGNVLFRLQFPAESSVDSGRLTSKDTFVLLVRPHSGNNNEVRQYAFGTGKLVSRSRGWSFDRTLHTAYSLDGSLMAVVHTSALSLHDTTTAAEKWKETLPAESITDCCFFHDAKIVAVAGKGEVKLYGVADGKLTGTLKVPGEKKEAKGGRPRNRERDQVSDLKTSADGKCLAASVGEDEDTVVCWDVSSAAVKHTLKPAGKPLGFSPDGSELATIHGGTVTFWTLATGKPVRTFGVPGAEIHLSPDGRIIAVATGDSVVLIDAITGKSMPHSADPPGVPSALGFVRPHRLRGRLSDWGGWVEWDVRTGAKTLVRPPGVDGQTPIDLSADGKAALYRSGKPRDVTAEYTVRELATGKAIQSVKGDADVEDTLSTCAMTPDGKALVNPTTEGLAVITEMGRRVIARPGEAVGKAAVTVTNGAIVAVGYQGHGEQGYVDVYDLAAGKHLRRLTTAGDVGQITLGPGGTRLAVSHDIDSARRGHNQATVSVFDLRTGKAVFKAEPDQRNRELLIAYSLDGRWLARLGDEGKIGMIEVASGQVRTRIEVGKDAIVNAIAFSPDGRTLAVSVNGGPVFLWDLYAVPTKTLSAAESDQSWELLKVADEKSFDALKRMVGSPAESVGLLKSKVAAVTAPDPNVVGQLVADLDHREFRKREAAAKALAELGERARDAINKALAGNPSPEARERMERLLAAEDRPTPELIRRLRAIEVIEVIGTPEAAKLLADWARGAAGATFTVEAATAVRRLAERSK